MRARARLLAAALVVAAGCGGAQGTIELKLASAPGSHVLADVTHARLTLTDPHKVVEADRGADGKFHLALSVQAKGQLGYVTFEGLDASGKLIAFGRTGPLPIVALNDTITVYVAPPMSLAQAPVMLDPPRTDVGVAELGLGAVLVGGRSAAAAAIDNVDVYDVYRHALEKGAPLPAARANPTAIADPSGVVYVFGGLDSAGNPASDTWSFDTTVAPAGSYAALTSDPSLARAGAAAAELGDGRFFVTGDPPVVIDPVAGGASALNIAATDGTATAVDDGGVTKVLITGADAGAGGAALWDGSTLEPLSGPAALARTGHAAVALPDGDVLVLGGATAAGPIRSAVRYHAADRSFTVLDNFLTTARSGAAVAATPQDIIVAGGRDAAGQIVDNAEVFDASTLAPVAELPMVVPRADAVATPLANGQILIAGGVNGEDDPIGLLELFTPGA